MGFQLPMLFVEESLLLTEEVLEAIEPALELSAISRAKSRLLSFFIFTWMVVARAPATSRLGTVAPHLASFAATLLVKNADIELWFAAILVNQKLTFHNCRAASATGTRDKIGSWGREQHVRDIHRSFALSGAISVILWPGVGEVGGGDGGGGRVGGHEIWDAVVANLAVMVIELERCCIHCRALLLRTLARDGGC